MKNKKSQYEIFREKVKIILYGTNTILGRMFDLVLLGLILLSVLLIMLDTVQGISSKYHYQLWICEWIITIFFTIEYVLRIISIQKPNHKRHCGLEPQSMRATLRRCLPLPVLSPYRGCS